MCKELAATQLGQLSQFSKFHIKYSPKCKANTTDNSYVADVVEVQTSSPPPHADCVSHDSTASKQAPAGCTHFPDVQPIIQRVLEGAHLHLSNQLFLQAHSTSKGSQRTANNTEQFSNINTERSENCKQYRAVRELQTTQRGQRTANNTEQRITNNTTIFSGSPSVLIIILSV